MCICAMCIPNWVYSDYVNSLMALGPFRAIKEFNTSSVYTVLINLSGLGATKMSYMRHVSGHGSTT